MKTDHPFLTSPKTHAAAALALTLLLVLAFYLTAQTYVGHTLSGGAAAIIAVFGGKLARPIERYLNSHFGIKQTV